jgi:hypothetical protein
MPLAFFAIAKEPAGSVVSELLVCPTIHRYHPYDGQPDPKKYP